MNEIESKTHFITFLDKTIRSKNTSSLNKSDENSDDHIEIANKECHEILQATTHWQVLGLKKFSSEVLIRKAYKNLSNKFFPENNPSLLAGDCFDKISLAFQSLTDSEIFSLKLNNRKPIEKIDPIECYKMYINNKVSSKIEFLIDDKKTKPPAWDDINLTFSKNSLREKNLKLDITGYSNLRNPDKEQTKSYNHKEIEQRIPEFLKANDNTEKEMTFLEFRKLKQEKELGKSCQNEASNINKNKNQDSAGSEQDKINLMTRILKKREDRRKRNKFLGKLIPSVIVLLFFIIKSYLFSVNF